MIQLPTTWMSMNILKTISTVHKFQARSCDQYFAEGCEKLSFRIKIETHKQ